MIYVVAPPQETWELEGYLHTYGTALASTFQLLTYDEIVSRQEIPVGNYVLVAIDQLTATEKQIAVQCCEALVRAYPKVILINHPSEVLLRYAFLKACSDSKRNSFSIRRANEFLACRKFPVFLRNELDHMGSLSGLLYTRGQLARAVARNVAKGYRLNDLVVVEYCDTVDREGMFRKYSAFIVGDRILPSTLTHSTNWITKARGRLIDADTAREELIYLRDNPHVEWLRETFDLARIRYGRIDYGIKDGQPQVWEINTNPDIAPQRPPPRTPEQIRLREPGRQLFFSNFQAAWEVINSAAEHGRTVPVVVSQEQRRQLAAERQRRSQGQARRAAISQYADFVRRMGSVWQRHTEAIRDCTGDSG